jgi:UTP--glucose-1-phosphate uridylyltransferase
MDTLSGNHTIAHPIQPAPDLEARFAPFAEKMQQAGLPAAALRAFHYYYAQLVQGETGYIASATAQPVRDLPIAEELVRYQPAGQAALDRLVVLKLNGGLGTSMGMAGPKSLVTVKDGLTFLDITVRQTMHLRQTYGARLPLVLMNSFSTQHETLAALTAYPALAQDVPFDFLHSKAPKIWQADLTPATWPADPEKEWYPPGHGDIYLTLQTSGMLQQLLAHGYEYAFVSNADNLGATVDLAILGYFAEKKLSFLMEVAKRQPADRKGGHLAMHPDKGLILREIAQCPPDELTLFQDIRRYCYFNTNNLWLHLPAIQQVLAEHQGFLALPLIRNEKAVDPSQPETPRVYQLETAMGQAIALFAHAQAVQVARQRFLPVKVTNDLLALWSDLYVLNDDYSISINPARQNARALVVDLDERYYGLLAQLQAHFPNGAPSLVHRDLFRVEGDIYWDGLF